MGGQDAIWAGSEPDAWGKSNHMVIECMIELDPLALSALKEAVSERWVAQYPRFSQRMSKVGSKWFFEDYDDFNIDEHVFLANAPGAEASEEHTCGEASDGKPTEQIWTHREVQDYAAQLMSEALPLDRSPWQMHFIPLFSSRGRQMHSALVFRIHHAMADGVCLVRLLLESLADQQVPLAALASPSGQSTPSDSAHAPIPAATATVLSSMPPLAPRVLPGGRALCWLDYVCRGAVLAGAEAARMLFACPDRSPLHGVHEMSGTKAIAWSHTVSVDDLRTVRGVIAAADGPPGSSERPIATRVTFNDVLMGILGQALHQYLLKVAQDPHYTQAAQHEASGLDTQETQSVESAGSEEELQDAAPPLPARITPQLEGAPQHSVTGLDTCPCDRTPGCGSSWRNVMRVSMPVSLRPLGEPLKMQNSFSLILVQVPLTPSAHVTGLPGVDTILTAHREMSAIKASGLAFAVMATIKVAFATLPSSLAAFLTDFLASKTTGVLTNVPGPTSHVAIAGAKAHDIVFWAPSRADLGVTFSLFTYAGSVRVAFKVDTGIVSCPELLAAEFDAEFERTRAELQAAFPSTYERVSAHIAAQTA